MYYVNPFWNESASNCITPHQTLKLAENCVAFLKKEIHEEEKLHFIINLHASFLN